MDRLRAVADQIGPTYSAGIDLTSLPAEAAGCPAFAGLMPGTAQVRLGGNRGLGK